MVNKPDINKIWYLASPYSTPMMPGHTKLEACDIRHKQVEWFGAQLMNLGYILWEPIASSYFKAKYFDLPQTYEFWQNRDRTMIENSAGVIVCDIQGWKGSTGVTDEVQYARSLGKPVYLVQVDSNQELIFSKLV